MDLVITVIAVMDEGEVEITARKGGEVMMEGGIIEGFDV